MFSQFLKKENVSKYFDFVEKKVQKCGKKVLVSRIKVAEHKSPKFTVCEAQPNNGFSSHFKYIYGKRHDFFPRFFATQASEINLVMLGIRMVLILDGSS